MTAPRYLRQHLKIAARLRRYGRAELWWRRGGPMVRSGRAAHAHGELPPGDFIAAYTALPTLAQMTADIDRFMANERRPAPPGPWSVPLPAGWPLTCSLLGVPDGLD